MKRIFRNCVLSVFCVAICFGELTAQTRPLSDLDSLVERVISDWNAPGAAVAVVHNDSVVFRKGFGAIELNGDARVDEHTLFAIASTSKAFTAAAIGMLVDEGLISWDDPVAKYLPYFQLADPFASREITVRDILSHRSGLSRGDRLWYLSPFGREEILRRVRYLEPSWSFRSQYGYQNIMFLAAGEIVGAVSGSSWDEFLDNRIFTPLAMARTSTTTRGFDTTANVAMPHIRHNGAVIKIPWPNFDNLGGAGAINSSVADMAEWLRLQLGGGVYRGDTLLSDSTMEEMHSPQTVVRRGENDKRIFPESHLFAYGLGWRLQDYRGRLLVRHGGALDGMRTHVLLLPEENLGVVAITNLNESRIPETIVFHVADHFLGHESKDWHGVMLAAAEEANERAARRIETMEAARVAGTNPSVARDQFVGVYEDRLYGRVVVRASEDGVLQMEIGPNFSGTLQHWHYDVFRATWENPDIDSGFVQFGMDRAGRISSVEVEGFGNFLRVGDAEP